MTAVLVSNLYKAASKAKKAAQPVKSLPVSSHLLLWHKEGRLMVTPFLFEDRDKFTEPCPAMTDIEFAACVPARAFVDWLRASQLTPQEKRQGKCERLELSLDPQCQILTATINNCRASFKCMSAQDFPPVS